MNISAKREELQKTLNDLQGQKAHLQVALEQITIAIERTIGGLQMLDTLEKESPCPTDGSTPAPTTPPSAWPTAGAANG